MVPEVLFNPGDIGIDQGGIHEAAAEAMRACAAPLRPLMCANVLLTGGNSLIPNALERLERSLRSLVPPDYELSVSRPDNPALSAWRGGSHFAASSDSTFNTVAVSRQEYEESGAHRLRALNEKGVGGKQKVKKKRGRPKKQK